MNYPQSITEAVRVACSNNPTNTIEAAKEAEGAIRKLPEYDEFVRTLVSNAVMGMVTSMCHSATVAENRRTGVYGGPAKVQRGSSIALNAAYESIYNRRIGEVLLGSIFGRDLVGMAEWERERGAGHYINAKLLESLAIIVPTDKTVREAVSEKRLETMLQQSREAIHNGAA